MTDMNVARMVAIGAPLEVGTADVPEPGPKEVRVKVAACGLVPNSWNVVNGKTPFSLPAMPYVFGLDAAGTVDAVGEHVLNLSVGDRVWIDPLLVCGTCDACRSGRGGCPFATMRGYMGTSPRSSEIIDQWRDGGLAQYTIAPDEKIHLLPDSLDFLTASRLGYLGTSYNGLMAARFAPGKAVLINGVTGTLGVAAVAIALALGATRILGIGRNRERLELLRRLAPERIDVLSSEDDTDPTAWVRERTAGLGVDVLYDCLGVGGDANSTDELVATVRPSGSVALAAGGAVGDITRSYSEAMAASTPIVGTGFATRAEMYDLLALLGSGVIDLSFLQHRTFTLDEVDDALAFVGDRPGGHVTVSVLPNGPLDGTREDAR
ncbi:alcohol dehydrogenase catalytic domain-containing protein [Rathayibacter sp. ZW T2_19]|uniref:Alcohol dehydrogenase catalytic domain-containing protein n=1 Tax=Rathayibacter rubneri TaxID=2950106 RepID=A0A9X2DWZ0_9MICO|nr:alcohol dehydrogenase catalytic domain-containing protein [Rathayibacter rubneri]MCM6762675.1 alcohol dehydrogenase catalytic domain-containing protein [Rathayibacter rubneri]